MRDLVALDLEPSDAFVAELQRAWDDGDAVLPIDSRLPPAAKAAVLDAAEATVVVTVEDRVHRAGRPVEAGDAIVVATSGTTGEPKAAVLTHDAVAASAHITSAALDVDPDTDHWLACLPLAHIGGLSVVTRALLIGTPVTVHPRIEAAAVAAATGAGATLVSLVVAALERVDISAFRKVLLGGSAIPSDRPANTVATYGMTETGSGIVYDGYALDHVELRIVDGEIHVRSPTLLRAYRDGTDPKLGDGWLPTGDGGALADDGRLTVHGRIAEVINTGGEKVWPVQVERAIAASGLPADVAVVGRPDPDWGEVVTAVVEVGRTDGPVPELEDLRDRLRDVLPGYALPRRIESVTALPRSGSGKIARNRL